MARTAMKVRGLRELEQKLIALPERYQRPVLERVAKKALEPMRARAESLAPVETGDLRGAIVISKRRTRRVAKSPGPKQGVRMAMGPASGGGVLNYAALEEFGTVHAPPQPYMRPAWDSEAEGALEIVKVELAAELERGGKPIRGRPRKAGS